MDNKTKLYQKMFTVMQNVDHIAKDIDITYSGSKGYKAISESTVTRTIRKEFLDNKLMVFPVEQEIEKTAGFTQTNTKYKIVDIETGESEILVSSGQGADTQDKGAGKAMTYSYKYMLLRTFMIPTGEDPDNISNAELEAKEKIKKTEPVKTDPDAQLKKDLVKKHKGNKFLAKSEYINILADRKAKEKAPVENKDEFDKDMSKYIENKFEMAGAK